ncbi:hypothetical protein BKA56DRAFT_622896 [Ilyonectria sp. MPI-CAGE-AT-0026]|nr:hypothetical protein BKA56DRAFT_622896 [Ilyonectria sp. MPI-CAGE-AT-0026]
MGRRRPNFLVPGTRGDSGPLFNLQTWDTLLAVMKGADDRIELLRRQAARIDGLNADNTIIAYFDEAIPLPHGKKGKTIESPHSTWSPSRQYTLPRFLQREQHKRWINPEYKKLLGREYRKLCEDVIDVPDSHIERKDAPTILVWNDTIYTALVGETSRAVLYVRSDALPNKNPSKTDGRNLGIEEVMWCLRFHLYDEHRLIRTVANMENPVILSLYELYLAYQIYSHPSFQDVNCNQYSRQAAKSGYTQFHLTQGLLQRSVIILNTTSCCPPHRTTGSRLLNDPGETHPRSKFN